jgi:hypothetical protein
VALRKQVGPVITPEAPEPEPTGLSIAEAAIIQVTSEDGEHPVDHLFDAHRGPRGTRWIASSPGDQTIILAFGEPQTIRGVTIEIEEPLVSRTQELTVSVSQDGGKTYTERVRQEYNFSPPDTSFEREQWKIPAENVTHLRIWIRPDKGGKLTYATMTSLRLQ